MILVTSCRVECVLLVRKENGTCFLESRLIGRGSETDFDSSIKNVALDLFHSILARPQVFIMLSAEMMLDVLGETWKTRAEWAVNISPVRREMFGLQICSTAHGGVGVDGDVSVASGKVFRL